MAILFDWYEDPKPSDKQQGENENTLHPRIKYNGSTGTDVLRRRIQERCSLTETDVSACIGNGSVLQCAFADTLVGHVVPITILAAIGRLVSKCR